MNSDEFLEKYADEKGNVRLYDRDIFVLPKNLTVLGDLDLHMSNIKKLPNNLTVHGHLILRHMKIKKLPKGLTVHGTLDLRNTKIKKIPKDIRILRTLELRRAEIKFPSKKLKIGKGLNLFMNKQIKKLPKKLYVGERCELFGTEISVLPETLIVGESLSLPCDYLENLPKKLSVGGTLYVDGKLIFNPARRATYSNYVLPSTELLEPISKIRNRPNQATFQKEGDTLLAVLSKLGIEATVNEIVYGPIVTQFEICSNAEILHSRIKEISIEISKEMERETVKGYVLAKERDIFIFEISNMESTSICIREVLESEAFQNAPSPLTFAMGQDTAGEIITMDIAKISPLLVAGVDCPTNSNFIEALILSILYKTKPDEVKLVLLDGKGIEFSPYDNMPHLLRPVVGPFSKYQSSDENMKTDYIKTLNGLMDEIDRRLQIFETLSVKDLDSYNIQAEKNQHIYEKLPYILIVFEAIMDYMQMDEDMMNKLIVRLKSQGQIVGIHIAMFTFIAAWATETIKENCSSRISFKLQPSDIPNFILGADDKISLFSENDMLFQGSDGIITRLHSADVDWDEVGRVANFCKKQAKPVYIDLSAYEAEDFS